MAPFSKFGTAAFSLAFVAALVLNLWTHTAGNPVALLQHPAEVAIRGAEREIELFDAAERSAEKQAQVDEAAERVGGNAESKSTPERRAGSKPDPTEPDDAEETRDAETNSNDLGATLERFVRTQREAAGQFFVRAAADIEAHRDELLAERAELISQVDAQLSESESVSPGRAGAVDGTSAADELRTRAAELTSDAIELRIRAAALLASANVDWRPPLDALPTEHADDPLLRATRQALDPDVTFVADPRALDGLRPGVASLELRRRLAEKAGSNDLAHEIQAAAVRDSEERLARIAGLVGLLLPLLLVGAALLVASPILGPARAIVGSGPGLGSPDSAALDLPAAWAVFVRYFVLFQLLTPLFLGAFGGRHFGFELMLGSLPLIGLLHLAGLERGRSIAELAGIDVDGARPLRILPVTLAGWTALAVAAIGASSLFGRFGSDASWASPIVDAIIDDNGNSGGLLRDAVLWAPIFEEIAFRGVLFAGLRRRFAFLPSAVASSALFGAVHAYDVTGILTIVAVGMVLAAIYERTRSLVPCIFAHALFNYSQLAFMLRLLN